MVKELTRRPEHPVQATSYRDRWHVPEPDAGRSRRARFRVPVGVALGGVFSTMLVVICSVIIFYMAAFDRRIAGRLLQEQAEVTLAGSQAVLDDFFDRQTLLFQAVAVHARQNAQDLSGGNLSTYQGLMPDGVRLRVEAGPAASPEAVIGNAPTWSGIVYDPEIGTKITADMPIRNGRTLVADYPRTVFQDLIGSMRRTGEHVPFLLVNRDTALAIADLAPENFTGSPDAPLPPLQALTDTPLHQLWQEQPGAHDMAGSVSGRVYPSDKGMFTAIYREIPDGPAQGWVVGTLYRADEFGAAFDQSRVVVYAAGLALLVGGVLSFVIGRMLGRPLTRLAETSARIRDLDFAGVERLPRSRIAELDDVNTAFNGTLSALSAFARYVPNQLVKRLIAEGMTDPRQIETRDMTIVFTDLAGFTNLASHLSAAETAAFLNQYFETVSAAIAAEDGTIDKFLGDGVMAFWGAPSDQPDHAEHAIASMRALAESIRASDNPDMRVRIGVHTGKVVVGNIGSSSRMNYTVIGDAVNVAARLQEYGKTIDPDAKVIVLASGVTMARQHGGGGQDLGRIALRGRDETIDVVRVV